MSTALSATRARGLGHPWALVDVPFLLGGLIGGQVDGAVILLLVAVSGLFIARESLLTAWRAWWRDRVAREAELALAVYLGLSRGSGLLLVRLY